MNIEDSKILAMLALTVLTFTIGMLPKTINSQSNRLLIPSALSCFSAGVFLCTSMMHMLPQAKENLSNNAEMIFCSGFLFMYIMDELIHYCCSVRAHTENNRTEPSNPMIPTYDDNSFDEGSTTSSDSAITVLHGNQITPNHPNRFSSANLRLAAQSDLCPGLLDNNSKPYTNYGSTSTTERDCTDVESDGASGYDTGIMTPKHKPSSLTHSDRIDPPRFDPIYVPRTRLITSSSHHSFYNQRANYQVPMADVLHHANLIPCHKSKVSQAGLFVALIIRASVDSLPIGIEKSTEEMWELLESVGSRLIVLALCFGLELVSTEKKLWCHIIQTFFFSLSALLGIGISSICSMYNVPLDGFVISIAEAIIGGVLLYVIMCEILPRERIKWHLQSDRPLAGFVLFVAIGIGVYFMHFLSFIVSAIHGLRSSED